MSAPEWSSTVDALARSRQWDELWRVARTAPPLWGVDALRRLSAASWRPPGEAVGGGFDELAALAAACGAELPTGAPFAEAAALDARCHVSRLATTADHHILAVQDHGRSVRVWRYPQDAWNTPVAEFSHSSGDTFFPRDRDTIWQLAVTPDGRQAITGGRDGTVRLFDLPSGTPAGTLTGHRSEVISLVVTPDGRHAASGSYDQTVRLWRLPAGKRAATLKLGWRQSAAQKPHCLAVSPDSRLLVSDGTPLRFWELPRGRAAATADHPDVPSSLLVTPDGRLLAVGSHDGTVRLYRFPSGEPAGTLAHGTPSWNRQRCLVAVTPDSRLLVTAGDWRVRLWELPSGAPAGTLTHHETGVTGSHWATVRCLVVTPDGRLLATGCENGTVQLWHLPSGAPAGILPGHAGAVTCLATSPDGRFLVSAGDKDGAVRVWQSLFGVLGRTPVEDIRPGDVDVLLSATAGGSGPERRWATVIATLARWRHRHDIALGEPGEGAGPGAGDIELT